MHCKPGLLCPVVCPLPQILHILFTLCLLPSSFPFVSIFSFLQPLIYIINLAQSVNQNQSISNHPQPSTDPYPCPIPKNSQRNKAHEACTSLPPFYCTARGCETVSEKGQTANISILQNSHLLCHRYIIQVLQRAGDPAVTYAQTSQQNFFLKHSLAHNLQAQFTFTVISFLINPSPTKCFCWPVTGYTFN